MVSVSQLPPNLKRIQPYLKIAEDHDKKDVVVAYWCRLYAVQAGLKVTEKTKESSAYLFSIMDWLETSKKSNQDNEAISNEVVAQAHIENYALKLFLWADNEDRSGNFNKNVVKAFYTAGLIYDVVSVFGELSDEVAHHKKYAKWKATYIHNCLKNGVQPVAGPLAMEGEGGESFDDGENQSSMNEYPSGNWQQPGEAENNVSPDIQAPYPVNGMFGNPGFVPMNLIPPMPGAHAPPSTPSGSSQHSPSSNAIPFNIPEKSSGEVTLQPEDFHKAQKYCKWAGSALQYEDVPTAVANLQKALLLLTTGKDE